MDPQLLVVTGLRKEARAARGSGIRTICSGGDSARLRSLLHTLDPAPFCGVVSFGIAGGLDPALAPGDILVGTAVGHRERRHSAKNTLSDTLMANAKRHHGAVATGEFVGSDEAIIRIEDKAVLRTRTGAAAVDMESHVVAEWADRYDLPFAILRVISDPAHRALPPLAAQALTPSGRVDIGRVLMGLARRPGQLPALADAGRDARAAFGALGRCGGLLGPFLRLGLADL